MRHLGDLRRLAGEFDEVEGWPDVPCPACVTGTLAPKADDSIVVEESLLSRKLKDHDDHGPDWISGYFHGALECRLPSCGETVVVAGEYRVVQDGGYKFYEGNMWGHAYKVKCFVPALSLIREDDHFPQPVMQLVVAASAVLWMDPSSAANRIRAAIEELLNLQGVPRFFITKKRERRRRTANERIELLKARKPKFAEVADLLMAVKWIGNDGSHGSELTVSDVLDGVELLNHALELVYDTSVADLKRKALEINKRKGIARKRPAKAMPR